MDRNDQEGSWPAICPNCKNKHGGQVRSVDKDGNRIWVNCDVCDGTGYVTQTDWE